MGDPSLFNRRASAYERGRPAYPAALFERLSDLGLMRPGQKVLDVGAGTGQATAEFVAAGVEMTAVEPGAELAKHIAAKCPTVSLLETRLEDAPLPSAYFDAAICATALHWLDLDVALTKLHHALVDRGWFAVWWTVFGDPQTTTPFRQTVASITTKRATTAGRRRPSPLDIDYWRSSLAEGGLFEVEESRQFRWSIDMTANQIADLFSTFTDWSDSEVAEAATAVEALGGAITEHYVTALYLCRAITLP